MKRVAHDKKMAGEKRLAEKLIMLFLLVLCFGKMTAQETVAENYPVRLFTISSNDGLSQGFVPCIRQDKRGFLWFATKDGLNKYDGYKFTVYRHDPADPHSVSDNFILGIMEDSRGYIWVITPGKLDVFDPENENFYPVNYSPAGREVDGVNHLTEDAFGNIWFDSYNEYFCLTLKTKDPKGTSFPEKFSCESKPGTALFASCHLPAGAPGQLYFDQQGGMWIPLADSLFFISKEDQLAKKISRRYAQDSFCKLPGAEILYIMKGNPQTFYMLTTAGVVIYNVTSGKIEKIVPAAIRDVGYRNACCADENSNAWLWYDGQLHFLNYEAGKIQVVAPVNIPAATWGSYSIEAVLVDRSGMVWMGSNGYGVFKYNSFVAKFHFSETGAMGWINCDNDGAIYISIKHELFLFNPEMQKAGAPVFTGGIFDARSEGLDISAPEFFVQDKQNIFWLAYGFGCLARYDDKTKAINFYRTNGSNSGKTRICRVWLDSHDHPWILEEDTNRQCSVHHFDPATKTFTTSALFPDKETKTSPTNVSAICTTPGDKFWFGTNHGLFCYDAKQDEWTQLLNIPGDKTSLSNDVIFSLCNDPKQPADILWVGTNSGGLARLNIADKKFVSFTEKEGLPNNVIYGILSDNSGNLWLSTNRGLCRFNMTTKECKNFYASDGLQNNEFNRFSYCKATNGALYFGGVGGLNFFYPEELNSGVHSPTVCFTGLRLFNEDISFRDPKSPIQKPLDFLNEIVLTYDQNVIMLKFSAMDYSAPEKNQFRYKLEGFDKEWTFSGTRNEAIYTGLAPGEYVFKVNACNSLGVWNEESKLLRITILPPWWRTWWAWTIYIFTGIALILFFLWLRTAALRKNQKVLEEKVKERTQELKASVSYLKQTQDQLVQNEKLASFGQLTAGIAHEIKNPLNFINNFSELSNELIEELKEAQSDEERDEILESLKSNLTKINHHGSRVDVIIKSMLQHSRSAGSVSQPTDINKLCDEYSNLAYHSMRANVPDFTCNIKKRLDPSLPVLSAIPQDISRVLLNLLNNAFYAVNEKRKVAGDDFRPELIVETAKEDNMAVIRIRDNGNGIPEEIKRKLFTPFFTTKPAGEGTGLGLSISSDIIMAHNGTLKVESVQHEFTEFTIRIPLLDTELVTDKFKN